MDAHIYSIIDKEKMKDMLHSFQACTGLLIQVIDENGAVVLSEGTGEPFCSQFQKHLAENDSCQKTHTNASKKAVELGETYIFSCHAGLNHIVFPLISRKAFFGSVLVGPFLMDTPDSSLIMEIAKNNSSQIELLPFTCVVDPRRYSTIYIHPEKNTFNDEATYMYKKQLEYGDILLLNKCDLISEAEKNAVLSSMKKNFPHAQIVPISAIDSENFESWTDEFTKGQKPSFRKLDIDWDYINHGDEHMGWFNNILKFSSSAPIDFNDVTVYLITEIQQGFL